MIGQNWQDITIDGKPWVPGMVCTKEELVQAHIDSTNWLIKNDRLDKGRRSTQPRYQGSRKLFHTTGHIIDFFYNSPWDTFWASDVDPRSIKKKHKEFHQKASKWSTEKKQEIDTNYIIQDDLKDDGACQIILDIDRHQLVDGAATMLDHNEALKAFSEEFGTVLWAQSYTAGEVFKGRIVLFLNTRTNKKIARKYIEAWLFEKFGSVYYVNYHKKNGAFFTGSAGIESTNVSHEFIDRVIEDGSRKYNCYFKDKMEIWQDGSQVWKSGAVDPNLVVDVCDISRKLRKYGTAHSIKLPVSKYINDGYLEIRDVLHPDEKIKTIEAWRLRTISDLEHSEDKVVRKKARARNLSDKELHLYHTREFKEGEISSDVLLKNKDGRIKTAGEFAQEYKEGTSNFAFEPNHREDADGYLYIKNGLLFNFEGGNTTLLTLIKRTNLDPDIMEYTGLYLPASYRDIVKDIDFDLAPTGSGKSANLRNRPDTIFICPTRALAEDLGNQPGFQLLSSSLRKGEKSKSGALYRIYDIPGDSTDTIVMTYDKFAYLDRADDLRDYNLVVDEAPLIFSGYSKYLVTRELLLQKIFDFGFKHVKLISANPKFWIYFESYITDYSRISVRMYQSAQPKPVFKAVNGFDEAGIERLRCERTIVYCNDKTRAGAWAKKIDAEVISADNRLMDQLDARPTQNFIFTSVMREGYSFHSNVDNFIVDTKARTIVGADSVIQAVSRARSGSKRCYLIHNLKESQEWMPKPSYHDIEKWDELLDIFYVENEYDREIWPTIKKLPFYDDMSKAIVKDSPVKFKSMIVHTCIQNIEQYQNRYIDWMRDGLVQAGYGIEIEPIYDIVGLKGTSENENVRMLFKKGPAAYREFKRLNKVVSPTSLINFVWGLLNLKHQKKARKPTLATALYYLTKVDIKYRVNLKSDGYTDFDTERKNARKTKKVNGVNTYAGPVMIFIEDIEAEFRESADTGMHTTIEVDAVFGPQTPEFTTVV